MAPQAAVAYVGREWSVDLRRWVISPAAVAQAVAAVIAAGLLAFTFWQSRFRPSGASDWIPMLLTAVVMAVIALIARGVRAGQKHDRRSLAPPTEPPPQWLDRDWPAIAMKAALLAVAAGILWALGRTLQPLLDRGPEVILALYGLVGLLVVQFVWRRRDAARQPVPPSHRLVNLALAVAAFAVGPLLAEVAVGAVHPKPWIWRCLGTAAVLLVLLVSWQAFRVARAIAASRFWLSWLVAFLLLAPAGLVAAQQMDALLAGRHLAGQASFRLQSLITHRPDDATEAVLTWWLHAEATRPLPRPLAEGDEVVRWYVLFDTAVVAPAVAGAFVLLLIRMRWRLRALARPRGDEDRRRRHAAHRRLLSERAIRAELPTPEEDAAAWAWLSRRNKEYRGMASAGVSLAVLLLVIDWVENLALLGLVSSTWRSLNEAGADPAQGLDAGALEAVLVGVLLVAYWTKVILVAVLAAVTIAIALFLALYYRKLVAQIRQATILLRGQLLIVACLAAALFLHEQAPDVLRRWDDHAVLFVTGIGLTMWLGLAFWVMARHLLWSSHEGAPEKMERWIPVAAVAVLLGAGLALRWWGLLVLAGIVVAIALMSLLVRESGDLPRTGPFGTAALPGLLAVAPNVLLGLAMLRGSVGIAVHGRRFETEWGSEGILIIVGTVLLISAPAIYNLLNRGYGSFKGFAGKVPARRSLLLWLGVHLLAGIGVYWTLHSDRFWGASYTVGTIGVLALFLIFASVILSALILFLEPLRPAAIFRMLRLRRTPVLSILLAWMIVTTGILGGAGDHDARLLPSRSALPGCGPTREAGGAATTQQPPASVGVDDVFDRWKSKNLRQPPGSGDTTQKAGVPLLMVASSGGGIRATYFTLAALQELFDDAGARDPCDPSGWRPRRVDRVLALSGVSGGSLGVAFFAAQLTDPSVDDRDAARALAEHVGGRDYLSPTMAWALFMDTAQALVRMPLRRDRAAVLEEAWERSLGPAGPLGRGLRELWFGHPGVPLLLLNGTTVESGCRFNASVLDANVELPEDDPVAAPGRDIARACLSLEAFSRGAVLGGTRLFAATVDLVDFLCSEDRIGDIRLSTAALLSARFPGISPAAGIPWHEGCIKAEAERKHAPTTYVVDGGYLDNSGASTLLELWDALEPRVAAYNQQAGGSCVVPFFLQIDNGYEEPIGPGGVAKRPLELLAPFSTADATRNSRAANARQAAAIEFNRPYGFRAGDRLWRAAWKGRHPLATRFARLSLQAHPGARAPLGWALSDESRAELDEQLSRLPANRDALARTKRWLTQALECRSSEGGA
jgi:hypothetical protein